MASATKTSGEVGQLVGTWAVDPAHSALAFSAKHMMISKVRGTFGEFEGEFTIAEDPAESRARATIKSATITTGNDQRDGHLRSPDFLESDRHPDITFASTKVELLEGDRAKLHGDLTIRGITRPVVLDIEYLGFTAKDLYGAARVGFSARTRFNRKDYDLTWNQTLETGGVLVGDEVTLELEVAATRQDA